MTVDEQIKKVMEQKVYKVHKDLVRAVATRFFGAVTEATPVDTGRARANWNMSVGRIDTTTTENTGAPDTEATANEALQGYDGVQTVYVSNHLPYIQRLNEGSSKQAPPNFVEKAVMLSKRNAEAAAKRGQP